MIVKSVTCMRHRTLTTERPLGRKWSVCISGVTGAPVIVTYLAGALWFTSSAKEEVCFFEEMEDLIVVGHGMVNAINS